MPPIAQIGSIVKLTTGDRIQIVHGPRQHEFIDDRSPFSLRVSDIIGYEGRMIGVYGPVVSGHDRYKGLIASLLIRPDDADWTKDNLSSANFCVAYAPVKPNGKHPPRHPEGWGIGGFPYMGSYGLIESNADDEPIVNSARGNRSPQWRGETYSEVAGCHEGSGS
jgi:hypothetical protein